MKHSGINHWMYKWSQPYSKWTLQVTEVRKPQNDYNLVKFTDDELKFDVLVVENHP